ncbi:MAG: hypothetical protein ACP5O8_03445 [Candidatus Aenigmatarchaeota archaeon]
MDVISFLISKEFEIIVNASFGLLWIPLGIFGLWLIFKLLGCLTKKEEVSMISFLLQPKEALKEIKLLFYACLIFFIGSIFGPPSFFFGLHGKEPILLAFSSVFGTFVLTSAAFYAVLIVYIFFRWFRRFRKYV